jgi:Mg2+ and Co2+ transporter CorA
MKLYDLKESYKTILDNMDNEDFDLSGVLETLDDAIEDKADGYARVITQAKAEIDSIDAEIKRLTTMKKSRKNTVDRLKENLFNAMKETGKTKFKTDLFAFSIAKNGGKIPVVVDVETADLPDDLVNIVEKPDLDALRDYIERTGDLTYAHFGERGESLRIK